MRVDQLAAKDFIGPAAAIDVTETGTIVIATPLKIEHGSGSPVRVIAIAAASAAAGSGT